MWIQLSGSGCSNRCGRMFASTHSRSDTCVNTSAAAELIVRHRREAMERATIDLKSAAEAEAVRNGFTRRAAEREKEC